MLNTKNKIAIARVAFKVIWLCRKALRLHDRTTVVRHGVRWALDINEGIDLTVYLFGVFERNTVLAYRRLVGMGDIVLDVGANIGAHTLPLARCVGHLGRVIAFEPTRFAFQKLVMNITLNPSLAPCIRAEQIMLVDKPNGTVPGRLYASWPLRKDSDLHAKHCGKLQGTDGARAMTLNEYAEEASLSKIHLIKIDVDGHECAVLTGGRETLIRAKPLLIMELAPYTLGENGASLEALLDTLSEAGYVMENLSSRAEIPNNAFAIKKMVPDGCSLNVLARPK